ncbi:hypothetical protein CDAR_395951 [Caerostris darwini]|uniref:Uncharacterized protein n=1 Tax=Caerostris darwini TaxID=1538125 RepID=A0AAV4WMW9_9ARAC|nr:hypothetical protein CDAR_395951 [Caerostris darwini]
MHMDEHQSCLLEVVFTFDSSELSPSADLVSRTSQVAKTSRPLSSQSQKGKGGGGGAWTENKRDGLLMMATKRGRQVSATRDFIEMPRERLKQHATPSLPPPSPHLLVFVCAKDALRIDVRPSLFFCCRSHANRSDVGD